MIQNCIFDCIKMNSLPWLNLSECLQLWDRNKDNNRLFSSTHVDFPCCRYLQRSKVRFQFRNIVLQVYQSLSYASLGFVNLSRGRVCHSEDLMADRHFDEIILI